MHRLTSLSLAALVLLAFAAPALADVVHLRNGGRIEGRVVDRGDRIEVVHRFGTFTVLKSKVLRIEKKATLAERYESERETVDPKNPDDLVRLGVWCRDNGWETRAVREFRAALELDPDHAAAHAALDHIRYEGEWLTEDEVMERKGFVRWEGEWVTEDEAAQLKANEERRAKFREERKRQRKLRRKLRGWFRDIAYGSKKRCDKAYDEVVTYAKEIGSEPLEKYAGEVKAYFDSYWKAVRQSQLGTVEIRATMSKLKRPIPTLRTSLGAGTTPVTLQLPELSVVRVQTTVVVPMGRGE